MIKAKVVIPGGEISYRLRGKAHIFDCKSMFFFSISKTIAKVLGQNFTI